MKYLFVFLLSSCFVCAAFGQGRSISTKKKITEPYITSGGDTIKVNTVVMLLEPKGVNNEYKYIQLLNGFNEPIKPANSGAAFKRQPVRFFKEADGAYYLFTKYFCVNIEGALMSEELKIIPSINNQPDIK